MIPARSASLNTCRSVPGEMWKWYIAKRAGSTRPASCKHTRITRTAHHITKSNGVIMCVLFKSLPLHGSGLKFIDNIDLKSDGDGKRQYP